MFERFTPRARRVLVVAQDEARNLGHSRIAPRHLLLGLAEGEGVAAMALRDCGLDRAALRERVAAGEPATDDAKHLDKIPFSPEAKKALELSLREALRLGHNYIGTEHLLLGVIRGSGPGPYLGGVLGLDPALVKERVEAAVRNLMPGSTRSPATTAALDRAKQAAGSKLMTTGDVLVAILKDPEAQASRALLSLGVELTALEAAVAKVDLSGTTDEPPPPRVIELRVGDMTTTIEDAELVPLLEDLSPEELRKALKRALKKRGG